MWRIFIIFIIFAKPSGSIIRTPANQFGDSDSEENYDYPSRIGINEEDDTTLTKSKENITLTQLTYNVDSMSKYLNTKLEALEEEMGKIRRTHDGNFFIIEPLGTEKKIEQEVERLKVELEQQLENQRQDISTLLTSSGHLMTPDPNYLAPCGALVTLEIPVDLTHTNLGNGTTEQTCVFIISSQAIGGSINFTLLTFDLGYSPVNNQSSLVLHQIFQNQSSPLVRRLKIENVGQNFSMEASSSSSTVLVFRSVGGQSFTLRVKNGGTDLLSLQLSRVDREGQMYSRVTANYLGQGGHELAGTFSYPAVAGRKYNAMESRHVILNSFPKRRIRLSIDSLDSQPHHDFLAVYKFSRQKNKFLFLQRFSGYFTDMNHLKFEADENEPMLLHFYSDFYLEEAGFRLSYSYRRSNELAASFWKSIKIQNSFDECGGLIPILSHTELTYVNPGQVEDGEDQICVWILYPKNGGPTSLLLEDVQNFGNETGKSTPILTIQRAASFDDLVTNLPRRITPTENFDQEIVIDVDPPLLLTFVSTRAGQSFRLALRDMGSFSGGGDQTVGPSNMSLIELQGSADMSPKSFEYSATTTSTSTDIDGVNNANFFLIPPIPRQTSHVTVDSVYTPGSEDELRIYRFSGRENFFEPFASFKYTGSLTKDLWSGSNYESEEGQPLLLYFQYSYNHQPSGFNLTYSYKNSGSMDQIQKLNYSDPDLSGPCGGSIFLSNNLTNLTFSTTDGSNNNNLTLQTCIWLLSASHGGAIGVTLIGENLNPSTSSLALHDPNLFDGMDGVNSTVSKFIQFTQNGRWREVIHGSNLAILVFTTNSSEKEGQGFQLLLRELGQVNYPVYLSRSTVHSNLTSIHPRSGDTGSFHFPSSEGVAGSMTLSVESVRQFIVLTPPPNDRVNLFMDFVTLNDPYDQLKVLQYSNSEKDFRPFQISATRQSHQKLKPGDSLMGPPDEPIMVYYSSSYFMSSSKFTMSYSSEPVYNLTSINGSVEVTVPTIRQIPCNELLTLHRPIELVYKNLDNFTLQSTCVWVISAVEGGPINFTLRSLSDDDLSINNLTTALTLHQIFPNQTSSFSRNILKEDINQSISIHKSPVLLSFQSWGGQSFHLDMEDLGLDTDRGEVATVNFLGSQSSTLIYPTSVGNYMNDERHYFIIKSMANRNISVSIDFVRTESPHDTLTIFQFSRAENKFLYLQRYAGSFGVMTTAKFVGEEGQPMLQYFHTDSSIGDLGFRLTYTYQLPNETTAKLWRTTQIPNTFDACGGLVTLPNYTEIFYTNGGLNESDNSTTTPKTTCVWLLSATNGGKLGLELESHDFIGGGQTIPGNLTVQTGLSLNFLKGPRQITSDDEGQEIETEDDSLALLVFTSGPGQRFRLGVREMGPRRHYLKSDVEFIVLKKPPVNSTIPAQYSYPSPPDEYYGANEQRLILVPGMVGKFINLSIDFVDTASSGDVLKIYKFLVDQKTFQYYGRFNGKLGQLNGQNFFGGEEGQNILLHFSSNSYLHGRGFILSYFYQNSSPDQVANSPKRMDSCGGFISLTQETAISYKHSGGKERPRRGEEICVWIVTGTREGVIGHMVVEANFDNLTDILSVQRGFVAQTFTQAHLIQPSDLYKEVIHPDHTLVIIFRSEMTGHGFRLRVREYGMSSNVVDIHPSKQLGQLIRLKGFEAGSYFQSFPPTLPGDPMVKTRLFVTLEPAAGQVVKLNIDNLAKDPAQDFLNVYKFSKTNQTFRLLQRFRGTGFNVDCGTNYFGGENEPLLLIYYFGGRRLGSQFTISYESQPSPPKNSVFGNDDEGAKIENSTQVKAADYWMRTQNSSQSCGGLVQATAQSSIEYESDGSAPKTCIWVIVAPHGGPMTWTLLSSPLFTGITLTIHQELGHQRAIVSRPIIPATTSISLGQAIPVKSQFAMLVFTSIGSGGKGESFKLGLRDLGHSGTIPKQDGVKVTVNYVGGWPGQNYGTYSYPPHPRNSSSLDNDDDDARDRDSDSQYGKQERRHVMVKCVGGKFLRLSIDFVSTDEMDDYLEIFKFSQKENKLILLQRYTGHLGYNLKNSVFDGDLGQPFLLYFSSDEFFQKKGFKISYWYHDPVPVESEVEKINKSLGQQPTFASDFCRKISTCNECVQKKCHFTGQKFYPCRAGDDLQDFDTPHKYQIPLTTVLECQENAGIQGKNGVLTKTSQRSTEEKPILTSLEIAGIVSIILIVLIILVILGLAIYARSSLDVTTTSGPEGPTLSISGRKNIENIRLVELQ